MTTKGYTVIPTGELVALHDDLNRLRNNLAYERDELKITKRKLADVEHDNTFLRHENHSFGRVLRKQRKTNIQLLGDLKQLREENSELIAKVARLQTKK